MAKNCRNCQLPMTKQNGNFEHVAFHNKVTLSGVPYWKCEQCGHQIYDDAKIVEEKIVEAIIKKQNEIDYN